MNTEKFPMSYITNFENRFPADILPEDSIMMVKTLEDYTRTEVANIAFGSEAEVVYTPAADAATTTADATAATDVAAADAAADTTAAAATTAASPVSTDGTAYADTHMYEVPLSPERGEGHGDVRLGTPYDRGSETSLGVLCETQCTRKRRSTA